ncbi:MAG TPA: YncE family protein [Blastocatellia bacterium]|nr:YncE family protein [Blastocatellia bacterium]
MKGKTLGFLIGCTLLVMIAGLVGLAGPSGYHLIKTIKIGGEGGWDYLNVDSANRKLYVSHGNHVVVIDIDKNEVVGDIPDTTGVHGIAIANDLNRGFTSNGRGNSVTIFDLKTLKVIGTVAIKGQNPDAIAYDPFTKRVFTFNGRSHDVTAIDGATGEVVGTLDVGGKPEFAQSNGKGRMFVNIEDKDEVIAFDPKALTVIGHWPLAPGKGPSGMAIDIEHNLIFSGCGETDLMVMTNTETGKVVGSAPIGKGVDANAYDPGTKLAFSSNGQAGGTLTVVHVDSPTKFTVVENVPTHTGARTMALDPKTHNVYLAIAEYGQAPPTPAGGRPQRAPMIPDSFSIQVYGK